MYYTVQTLLKNGVSISQISRQTGSDPKTIRKIRDKIACRVITQPKINRHCILDDYKLYILELYQQGLNSQLIYQRIKSEKGIEVSYTTVFDRLLRILFLVRIPENNQAALFSFLVLLLSSRVLIAVLASILFSMITMWPASLSSWKSSMRSPSPKMSNSSQKHSSMASASGSNSG